MTEAHILVFAKMPRPGHVKTRLVPPLTMREAAAVHAACLKDVVAGARLTGARLRILYDEAPGAEDYFARSFAELERERQSAGDLGCRLGNAFANAFAAGASVVVAIGADAPTLPTSHLREGLKATRNAGVALGPAADGGYYLLGLHHDVWPAAREMFRGIPWSTALVFETTARRAAAIGLQPRRLPPWYDIDRIADLELARGDARPDSHLARLLDGSELAWGPRGGWQDKP